MNLILKSRNVSHCSSREGLKLATEVARKALHHKGRRAHHSNVMSPSCFIVARPNQ